MSKIFRAGFKIDTNADKVAKDQEKLADSLDDTAKAQDKVNKSFEKGATFAERYGDELQPLTTRMGEAEDRLYELALAGDTTSKEYKELLKSVGEYRKVQIKTDLAVDGAAQTLDVKLGSALNAAASGFAAVQGAMALFGTENEALEESLLKVQGALAIQQGITGLTQAYKELSIGTKLASVAQAGFAFVTGGASTALKLFRLALVSTGIGAIVVGLGLLIANFDKVKESVTNVTKSFKEGGVVTKALMLAFAPLILTIKALMYALESLGVIESEEEKARKARQEAQIERERELLELQVKKAQQQRANAQLGKELAESAEKLMRKQGKVEEAMAKERERLAEELNEAIYNFDSKRQDAIRIRMIELDEEEAQMLEDKRNRYREYNNERLSAARKIQDLELSLLEEGVEKEVKLSDVKFERLIEDVKKNTKLTAKEREKLTNLYLVQQFEAEDKIRNKYRKEQLAKDIEAAKELQEFINEQNQKRLEKEKADKEILSQVTKDYFNREATERLGAYQVEVAQTNAKYNALVKLAEQYGQTTFHIEKERKAALAKLEEDNNQKTKEQKAELHDYIVQGAKDTFTTLGNLAQLFAGEDEKQQRKAFKIQKAANIANATIDTYAAAVAAYKSLAGVPVIGPVLGGAAAAAAVTAGLLNIKAISQQEFEGGGSEPDQQTGNFSGTGGAISPEFNIVGDSGIDQFALINQQPVQAYVVSGEVTSAQALDRNRVENATL